MTGKVFIATEQNFSAGEKKSGAKSGAISNTVNGSVDAWYLNFIYPITLTVFILQSIVLIFVFISITVFTVPATIS